MQAGKTIAGRREKVTSDSERERVRRVIRKRKVVAIGAVVLIAGGLVFLMVRMIREWISWASQKTEVIIVEKEPSVEVIDERTGKKAEEISSRIKEYIANLEEEFAIKGYKILRVRMPADKMRELDVEVEDFSGYLKVSTDRNPAVTAEDADRMIRYLAGEELVEYVDIRVERKAFWK